MKKYRNDFILVGILMAVALVALVLISVLSKTGSYVVVEQDGKETARHLLREDREFTVETDSAEFNTFRISDSKVWMTAGNCPDGLCMASPAISREGESIICLPHKLVLRIEVGNG